MSETLDFVNPVGMILKMHQNLSGNKPFGLKFINNCIAEIEHTLIKINSRQDIFFYKGTG